MLFYETVKLLSQKRLHQQLIERSRYAEDVKRGMIIQLEVDKILSDNKNTAGAAFAKVVLIGPRCIRLDQMFGGKFLSDLQALRHTTGAPGTTNPISASHPAPHARTDGFNRDLRPSVPSLLSSDAKITL